jgi:hypothetical protein
MSGEPRDPVPFRAYTPARSPRTTARNRPHRRALRIERHDSE